MINGNTPIHTLFKEQLENESQRIAQEINSDNRGDYLIWWYFTRLLNLSSTDVNEICVDGAGELGIDILRIDEENVVHFYQFKNPYNINKSFPESDVDKIISGLTLILNRNYNSVANEQLKQKIDEIYQTVPNGYRLHLVTSGNGMSAEAATKLNSFVSTLRGPSDTFFVWILEDIRHLQDWFYRRNLPTVTEPIVFEITRQSPYQVRSAGHDCYLFHASGNELAELYERHGEQLLQQNIRVYEGNKATNASIRQTCTTEDAANFFHFNNGITFLCESAAWDQFTAKLSLEKAQIVNGGQTIRVLFGAHRESTLRTEVLVPVRAITSQGDKEFGSNVAVNLNNQNKVDSSFLKSNHPRIVQLAHALASIGWYLERRENEVGHLTDSERETIERVIGHSLGGRIIRIKDGAQAYAATYSRQPELAKKNPKRLFESVTDGGQFEKIFSESLSAEKMVCAYRIRTVVDKYIDNFMRKKRKKQRSDDWQEDYKEILGDTLVNNYADKVDQVIPQSAIFMIAILFEEYVRIRGKTVEDLLAKLDIDSAKIISSKIEQIIKFAESHPNVADRSWPTLLKSQTFFDRFVSFLRGVFETEVSMSA